jgi:hypothetical protein
MDQSAVITPETAQLLIDLESQQDEVLRELDELNLRIEQVIIGSQLAIRRAEAEPSANPQAKFLGQFHDLN